MSSPNRVVIVLALAWLCGCSSQPSTMDAAMPRDTAALRILVFTRTAGFRHDSIPAGLATLRELASADGIAVDHTEDATRFDAQTLANYHAVVFLSTTRDVLDVAQQAAFERYVAGGGAWLGVHAAADTEYDWPWYGELAGAWFAGHPPGLQTARVRFEASHAGLADGWRVTDELYNYRRNPRVGVTVLATVDEADYQGGTMGRDHPIAWCHARLGGRAWYTGLGHDAKVYADPVFREHLRRGLHYTVGLSDDC